MILHEGMLGGASLAVLRCVPGLRERGWEFSFWVPPGSAYAELEGRGERVAGAERPIVYSLSALRLDPGPLARMRATPGYLRQLRARIKAEAPVLVHANSHVTLADAITARRAGVPTVIHIHEMFGDGRKWDIGRRLVARYGSEVVAVSDACADRLQSGERRPRIIRNGVDVPAEPSHGSGGDELVIGTVGAIARRKGIDVLVEAAALVAARGTRVRFELVGAVSDPLDAEWAAGVLKRAAELGIDYRERADVPAALDRWDAFLLPSRRDPFPLSMLEAMAAGLPVIGGAVDGIREQVSEGTGILVEPERADLLAAAIGDLAAMPPAERAALGAAARARVIESYTIEGQVEALDQAYLAAVAKDGR